MKGGDRVRAVATCRNAPSILRFGPWVTSKNMVSKVNCGGFYAFDRYFQVDD